MNKTMKFALILALALITGTAAGQQTINGNVIRDGTTPLLKLDGTGVTAGKYPKSNGSAYVTSTLSAAGIGTCTTAQFVQALLADTAPTCTTFSLLGAQFANTGTTTTVLHGNAAGNLSFGSVSLSADVTGSLPQASVTNLVSDLTLKAPLASPAFTGTPTVPTATPGTSTTQAASTAFTAAAIAAIPASVTSVTGTANEISSTGGTTPVLSLPSALTFTGKTVTGGSLSGQTISNALGVAVGNGSGNANVSINNVASVGSQLQLMAGNATRWIIERASASNAFQLQYRDSSGLPVDVPLSIADAPGASVVLTRPLNMSGNLITGSISGNAATVTTNANLTGPVTSTGNATTITATGVGAGGPTGSATVAPIVTYNAAGQLTAVSSATITPAVGSITGLGTGVATFLATPSSTNFAAAVTGETGTANVVFSDSPALTGTPTTTTAATPTNSTQIASTAYVRAALPWIDVTASPYNAVSADGVDDRAAIVAAIAACPSTGCIIYFPAGFYQVSANINVDKPAIFQGAGRVISFISATAATGNIFTIITGGQGAGFQQLRFWAGTSSASPATALRTAGYAVDFTTIANSYVQQSDILFQWSGIRSAGPLQFADDVNIREGGANATAGQGVYIVGTGDRYLRRLTMDQGSNPSGYACVRVNESSSVVISDSNLIHCNTALDLTANQGAGKAIASVYAVNTFFDTSVTGINITAATGNDTVQRVTCVRCWVSTMSAAGVVLGHANVNSVDFVASEFYQSPVGIDAQAATEWSVRASRFAGNTTAAIRTTAGATNSFSITDNVIGNVAGFGANALGINIQAGTYKRYQIVDNRSLETNTTPGIVDLGVVAATDQKNVTANMGGPLPCTIGADVTTSGTAAFTLISCRVPAGSVSVGTTFSIDVDGVLTATGNPLWSVAVGATNPATTVAWSPAAMTAAVTNGGGGMSVQCTVKSIGAGTVACSGFGRALALIASTSTVVTAQSVTTTADWYITARVAMSASTFRATSAVIRPN